MTLFSKFSKNVVKTQNFKMITKFIKLLLADMYVPFLFINIKDIIINNSNTHMVVQPEIENIIKIMKEAGYIQKITFFSEKDEKYKHIVYDQLVSLLGCEGWKLVMMSGYDNFSITILNEYINSNEIKSCYRPWIVYIDLNFDRALLALQIPFQFDTNNFTSIVYQERTWPEYFSSYFSNESFEFL